MKKIIILAIVLFAASVAGIAQDNPNYAHTKRGEYVATYYTGSLWGVNGFRSVEEENRIMDQNLAELRRQRKYEEMTPEQREQTHKRRQMRMEIKNDALQAKKEKEDAAKARRDSVALAKKPKKDTAVAKKEAPKTASAKPAAVSQPAPAKKETVSAGAAKPASVKAEETKKKK